MTIGTNQKRAAAKAPASEKSDAQSKVNKRVEAAVAKKAKRASRPFPAVPFEEAMEFAKQMFAYGSGQPVRRVSFFDHIKKSPESGASRMLITNSNKYGLTEGGYAADMLSLTDTGKKCVDEDVPNRERARARVQLSVLGIEPFAKMYEKLNGNKVPARAALLDQAKDVDVPEELVDEAVDNFVLNLRFVGLLQMLSGAERVVSIDHMLDTISPSSNRGGFASLGPAGGEEKSTALTTATQAGFETTCFYLTPIGDEGSETRKHSDMFLSSIVEPALEPFRLKVVRADAIDKPGTITKQIIEYILRSRLVIVDLSYHNPNVFYELALRHAARLPVVQIIRSGDKIPFDINQMRTVQIDTTSIYSLLPRVPAYQTEIAAHVRRALDDPDASDNPVSTYFPDFKLQAKS